MSSAYRGDDLDYQENFLKPELIKFLTKLYGSQFEENDPTKLQLRDKIIECAKIAIEVSNTAIELFLYFFSYKIEVFPL